MQEIKNAVLKKKPVILEKKNQSIISLFRRLLLNINKAPVNKHNGIKFFNNSIKT